jgi:hypothetical protein
MKARVWHLEVSVRSLISRRWGRWFPTGEKWSWEGLDLPPDTEFFRYRVAEYVRKGER